uniref:Uncharacterized protein n=1 Tax=Anguilla anguilla TaxID=7936 RepID=A0A0E9T8F4_ANGAN
MPMMYFIFTETANKLLEYVNKP